MRATTTTGRQFPVRSSWATSSSTPSTIAGPGAELGAEITRDYAGRRSSC